MAEGNEGQQQSQQNQQNSGSNGAQQNNGAVPSWLYQAPPEYRADPEFSRFKDIKEFFKNHKELIDYSKDAVRVPGPDASEKERAEFYRKVGRPEAPDKYEIKFGDGAQVDEKLIGSFREVAHKVGLTPGQAQELAAWYEQQSQGLVGNLQTTNEAEMTKLDKDLHDKWGWAYDRNVALASQTLASLVDGNKDHPIVKFLDETGLGDDPRMIEFFRTVADKLGEDTFVEQAPPGPEEISNAKEQLSAIMNDKAHPYWKGDREWADKVLKLREIILSAENPNG